MKPLTQTADETLAVVQLRRWLRDKTRARNGNTTRYQKVGWCERRARDADAVLVRILDFEAALTMLTPEQQELLIIVYGHGTSRDEATMMMHRDGHSIASTIATARRRLAAILDRRGIL